MELLSWVFEIQAITASGALSPGPLTIVTAGSGIKTGWKAGFLAALGHMIIEFPLVLLLSFGILNVTKEARLLLSFLGGAILVFFAFLQFKSVKNVELRATGTSKNAFLVGLSLTALNPYFILWWLTVGTKLILDSMSLFSFNGIFLMYVLHVWMDFAWLMLIAHIFYKGSKISSSVLKIISIILGCLMVYFGFAFMYNAITEF
jgi:threonine/homoserine/homoserine lactone efflux protein